MMFRSKGIVGSLLIAMMMSMGVFACQDHDDSDAWEQQVFGNTAFGNVMGVTWQLYGFGSIGVDSVAKVKPYKGDLLWREGQYTVRFTDSSPTGALSASRSFTGTTFSNDIYGRYDVQEDMLVIRPVGGTKVGEAFDGEKYVEALRAVVGYEMKDGQLMLFYNDGRDYMVFHADE